MDPTDPGQGQEKPDQPGCDPTPISKGRQRKKNSRYLDYDTSNSTQPAQERSPRRRSGRIGQTAASRGRPAKSGNENKTEAKDESPQEPDGEISDETPKKAVRAKRTPRKRTPAKKTPAKKTAAAKSDGRPQAGEAGVADAVKQENGTAKRKYVRKRPAKEVEPVPETPCKEAQEEPEEEEEVQPGGRRRRSAAKAAMKYLHIMAKECLRHDSEEPGPQPEADTERRGGGNKGRKGKKRKRADSDAAEDEDFVPDLEDEEAEEEEEGEGEVEVGDEDLDLRTWRSSPAASHVGRTHTGSNRVSSNGLTSNLMRVVWDATETTKKFREEHHSSWAFPAWIPSSSNWHLLSESDLEKYLPQELQSAAFQVSRLGVSQQKTPPQRLSRFTAVPAHPGRWDMVLFAGGPVWALEWCPTPDGAPASQYVALACHCGMDDLHFVNKMYAGPGLVQLWDLGQMEYNSRPDSPPALAYGLAQDKGFIWQIKWCPAGGWEPPGCGRKVPFLPRLGLLAVATSTGVVTIYSLPHPEALHPDTDASAAQQLPIYQAEGVVTLKLGSFRAPRQDRSGQVLSMDWLPEKPHNIMAIGFYDGVVGLWDLSTASALLRVREADRSLSLLPYRCLLAHDHAVRALTFCPASRFLLLTAGEDRYVKTWDLRRLDRPVTAIKRYLTNEVCWPLNACGFMVAQENAYAAKGNHGVHYTDLQLHSYFAVPRSGTLWSISYTDWLNSLVTSDVLGEMILAVLPQITTNAHYIKRTLDRRFPVYLTSLVPHERPEEGEMGAVGGEAGDAAAEVQEGGGTEKPDGGSESGRDGGEDGGAPPLQVQTYKEAVKKYFLQHTDNNMETFARSDKVWKRMKNTELLATVNMDEIPLAALHKVRFSPNMCSHTWVVSGGRTGLVRLHCLKGLITPEAKKIISENAAHFDTLYSTRQDRTDAVQTATDDL